MPRGVVKMASTNFTFTGSYAMVTYDLENNDITAQQIADASGGKFVTMIEMKNGIRYNLPNTTLWDKSFSSIEDTILSFRRAFQAAKSSKWNAKSVIRRVMVLDVSNKPAYMEDER